MCENLAPEPYLPAPVFALPLRDPRIPEGAARLDRPPVVQTPVYRSGARANGRSRLECAQSIEPPPGCFDPRNTSHPGDGDVGKTVAITGINSYFASTLLPRLQADPEVETIIGIDVSPWKGGFDKVVFHREDIRSAQIDDLLAGADVLSITSRSSSARFRTKTRPATSTSAARKTSSPPAPRTASPRSSTPAA